MNDSECLAYDKAVVVINFPAGHVCCDLCPLLETYARKQSRRTGEYLLDTRTTGMDCPLNVFLPDWPKKEGEANG